MSAMIPTPSDREIMDRAIAEIEAKDAEIERLRADNERLHGAIAEIREMLGDGEVDDADIAECFLEWEV